MVWIRSDTCRVKCPVHGVVTAIVPWTRHGSRFTLDFEHMAAWLAMHCSKYAVSQLMRISRNPVGPIISRVRAELDIGSESRFEGFTRIGIDETSYKKGHKYMTVIVNHDTGGVVWMAPRHRKAALSSFFVLLTDSLHTKLELVAKTDGRLWRACNSKDKKFCNFFKKVLQFGWGCDTLITKICEGLHI